MLYVILVHCKCDLFGVCGEAIAKTAKIAKLESSKLDNKSWMDENRLKMNMLCGK